MGEYPIIPVIQKLKIVTNVGKRIVASNVKVIIIFSKKIELYAIIT
jgi:hypothetical protein